jgi:hypothetical protein
MHYYWFANAKTDVHPDKDDWEHYLGVNVGKEGQDVDIYVTYGDGRLPTKTDNDFSSKMNGADFVKLSSQDKFWAESQKATKVGIFVVAIEAKTPQTNYVLQSFLFSEKIFYDLGALKTDNKIEDVAVAKGAYRLYQWYNWGGRDFEIFVESSLGTVDVFLNY